MDSTPERPEDSRAQAIEAVSEELIRLRGTRGRIDHRRLADCPAIYRLSGADNTVDAWDWFFSESLSIVREGKVEGIAMLCQMIFSTPAEDVATRLDFTSKKFSMHSRNVRRLTDDSAPILAVALVESSTSSHLIHNVFLENDQYNILTLAVTTHSNIGSFVFEPGVTWGFHASEVIKPYRVSKWLADEDSGLMYRQSVYRTRFPDPGYMVDGRAYSLIVNMPSQRIPNIAALVVYQNLLFRVATFYSPRALTFAFYHLDKDFTYDNLVEQFTTRRGSTEEIDPNDYEVPYNG